MLTWHATSPSLPAAYEQAGQIAEEKSKKAFAPTAPTRTVTYAPEEDDDADMAQSLARARRLALSQQKQIRGALQTHSLPLFLLST